MRTSLIVAAALAAGVNGAAIEARQRPRPTTTSRAVPGGPTVPDVEKCGLDAFIGHTSEALLFCSSILKGGTATQTSTVTNGQTITTRTTIITTLYPPSTSARPSSTARPPPSSTARPPTSAPPSSTVRPPTSSPPPPPPSSTIPTPPSSTPITTPPPSGASCGIVGYTKNVAAYYFDSSGTQNTWAACGAKCKADSKCKSWGYGEANCMLFDVTAAENTNYNPMSPYTFYDQSCPEELPVKKKRQIQISIGLPGGAGGISSACSCLITTAPAGTTKTTTVTTSIRTTTTETVTRTVSLLPGLA